MLTGYAGRASMQETTLVVPSEPGLSEDRIERGDHMMAGCIEEKKLVGTVWNVSMFLLFQQPSRVLGRPSGGPQ